MVLISLLSVSLAILIGGEPIRGYFLSSTGPLEFQGKILLESVFVFSFSVVAASYAFSARSSDQLSSQLLMLISTVAGGVFLKLYLDRHSGPLFSFLSSIFLWLSPCFTFSTCMFDLFALRATQMTLKFGVPMGSQASTNIVEVYRCIYIMIFQIVFYMSITVAVDCYWGRMQRYVSHWRYVLSLPLRSKVVVGRGEKSDRMIEMTDTRNQDNTATPSHSSSPSRPISTNASSSSSTSSSTLYSSIRRVFSSSFVPSSTPLMQSPQRDYNSTSHSEDQGQSQSQSQGLDMQRECPSVSLSLPPYSSSHSATATATATAAAVTVTTTATTTSMSPSESPVHIRTGKGITRILKTHGKVYGEIGMFPDIERLQLRLRQHRQEQQENEKKRQEIVDQKKMRKDHSNNTSGIGSGNINGNRNSSGSVVMGVSVRTCISESRRRDYTSIEDGYGGGLHDKNIKDNEREDDENWEAEGEEKETERKSNITTYQHTNLYSTSTTDNTTDTDTDCENILKAKDLFVEYSFGAKRKMALNGLNFQVKKGERVALLGKI